MVVLLEIKCMHEQPHTEEVKHKIRLHTADGISIYHHYS